jgi:hypothetical protein
MQHGTGACGAGRLGGHAKQDQAGAGGALASASASQDRLFNPQRAHVYIS